MQDKKPEAPEDSGQRPQQELWSEKRVRRILKELDQSGETVAHFARRHGWTPQRIHWWMSKLGWKRSSPMTAPQTPGTAPLFIPVEVVQDRRPAGVAAALAQGSGVVIELDRGRRIRVEPAFDTEVLRRVVKVLEEGAPC